MSAPVRASIDALLSPRSIAIVGASPTSYVGRVLCDNLRTLGYPGRVYPVNPKYEEVLGWPAFPSLEALPEAPDAVVGAVRIDLVASFLDAAGRLGVAAAVVPGGGFTETGPAALRAQEAIADVAAAHGMAVCGPNCMGVIAPPARSSMYIGTIPPSLLAGRVALVSQSGSVVEAAVNMGPRVGFSALVSCGNEAVISIGQYLSHFAADPATCAVLVFLEGFRDPAGFVEGVRALREAGKPVAVLYAGRSAEVRAAIAAHSGSLAGSDEVVTGLLRQLGAIQVDDLDELIELGELLGHGRLPNGRRLFVATDSGGEATLVADRARRAGLELPAPSAALRERLQDRWPNFSFVGNPIDPWGVDADYGSLYREVLAAAAEEDVDVLAAALDKVTTWAGENETHLGVAVSQALIEASRRSPALPVFFTLHATGPAAEAVREPLRAAGVPLLHGLQPALNALARAAWWQRWRPRTQPPAGGAVRVEWPEPGPVLSERASRQVLAMYGVPVVAAEVARSPRQAVEAAERLGWPVVLKADLPGAAHKAAAGLVRTGLASAGAVAEAFGDLERIAGPVAPARGVLVEATADGVELIVGMRRDPLFGPAVLVGLGGALTEALHEVVVRTCPLGPEDLDEMLEECAVGRLLRAVEADPRPALDVLAALGRLAVEHPEVEEVDVNPLFVRSSGAVAADALVVLGPQAAGPAEGAVPAVDHRSKGART